MSAAELLLLHNNVCTTEEHPITYLHHLSQMQIMVKVKAKLRKEAMFQQASQQQKN